MFNWWTKFLEIFELKRIQIRTSRLNLSIPSFFVYFGREWHDLLDHLLDKLKKKHIISKKLITCKLTGCYIDSYRQFFVVDHQQINHHMDQKKKTIKSRFHPFAPSFSKFRAKNSRLWSNAAASKVIICAPHFPVNYEYSGYTSLWRKQLQQWACKTAWFLKRTLFTS